MRVKVLLQSLKSTDIALLRMVRSCECVCVLSLSLGFFGDGKDGGRLWGRGIFPRYSP